MSGVGKVLGAIAGVALIATGVGAAAGTSLATAVATISIAGVSLATVSTIATVAAIGASLLQSIDGPSVPPARGNVAQISIGANLATPYIMGRTYFGGNLLHDVGYGPTIDKVPNPYRTMIIEYSTAGPLHALEEVQADFAPVSFSGTAATGYFAGFLSRDFQLGALPESDALAGPHGAIPDWGSAYKMSGHAAIAFTYKFDKNGKVYASGLPQMGAIWQGVLAYDPRLDSTYPGGSGACRSNDEATWVYTENPALHALTYAIGRHVAGKRIFGVGMPIDSIIVPKFVVWANVCDANDWKVGGVIFEPGDRYLNLRDIMAAGGAVPVFEGAKLSVDYATPRVSVGTITADDLADGDLVIEPMASWGERRNTIVPRYRSASHKWELVAAKAVTGTTYVTEDGEEKAAEVPWGLVQDVDQVSQLAAYAIADGREFKVSCAGKPHLRFYRAGDQVALDMPAHGLVMQKAIVRRARFDPATRKVELELRSETVAKHAYALGQTGVAPPTPSLRTTAELDGVASAVAGATIQETIRGAIIVNGGVSQLAAADAGTDASINISSHTWDYPTPTPDATRAAGTVTGLSYGTKYYVYFDDDTLAAPAPTYAATLDYDEARSATTANPYRHFVGFVTTPLAGGGSTSGGGGGGGGGGGPIP